MNSPEIGDISYFELSELVLMTYSTMMEQLTVFISVMFAYFAVAYLVGKKLSSFQLFAITLVYSAFSLIAIFGIWRLSTRLGELLIFRDGESSVALMGSVITCTVAWALSIVFMFHSRKQEDN